jgi:hypothetical protein
MIFFLRLDDRQTDGLRNFKCVFYGGLDWLAGYKRASSHLSLLFCFEGANQDNAATTTTPTTQVLSAMSSIDSFADLFCFVGQSELFV